MASDFKFYECVFCTDYLRLHHYGLWLSGIILTAATFNLQYAMDGLCKSSESGFKLDYMAEC